MDWPVDLAIPSAVVPHSIAAESEDKVKKMR
jgi:hypothetical protein